MSLFLNVLTGQPQTFQAAGAQAGAAASEIQALASLLQSGMTIASWTGPGKDAQQGRVTELMGLFDRLLRSMAQVQATAEVAAAQMQAAKTQTQATVTAAQAGRYQVFPTGTVTPGPWHYAFANAHPGAMGVFKMIAAQLTAQINASVGQSAAADTKAAAAVAQAVLQYLAEWLDNKISGSSAATAAIPTTAPAGSTLVPGTTTWPDMADTLPTAFTAGGLTGAGALAGGTDPVVGDGSVLAGAGAFGASLGGTTGVNPTAPGAGAPTGLLGGAGAPTGLLGGAGAPTGLLGGAVSAPAVVGGAGAGGAAGGRPGAAGGGPMAPSGHGRAAGRAAERRASADWLVEEGESWGPDDAPDPVVS